LTPWSAQQQLETILIVVISPQIGLASVDTVAITYICVKVFVYVIVLALTPWSAQPQLETLLIVAITPQ
jgi:hypothetical protein